MQMINTPLMFPLTLAVIFLPLLGSLIAGLFGQQIGRKVAQYVTTIPVGLAFIAALILCQIIFIEGVNKAHFTLYTWAVSGSFSFDIGFLIDKLSVAMMVIVTFVSFLVHIYSIAYMAGDSGYQRFFSYISLFTFAMLILVTANNFFQLFFGWEGVGLVSYLLIGFWFKRESANQGSLKAFLVNRIGDMGFILGIAAVLTYFGTVDYQAVFAQVPAVVAQGLTVSLWSGHSVSVITLICLLLFIGAMGKSAQMPLHVWLPESMEGPTPISALIHAATMVTAGVYMVARLSPLFEQSQVALSTMLVIGATTALFTGALALVQFDIKRVVAYSTLSQLGYMVTALGASAYSMSIFHLLTHACFKALLFLAAGSVIVALHHEQDMRKMGGLWKYLPMTYLMFLVGALALCAIPPFSGFYSKDAIIDTVHLSTLPGAHYAYYALLIGCFVTALYTFRAFFMTFHTKSRMEAQVEQQVRENGPLVWLPLVALALPSIVLGYILANPILFQFNSLFGSAIQVLPDLHPAVIAFANHYHNAGAFLLEGLKGPAFFLSLGGLISAWVAYVVFPTLPQKLAKAFPFIYRPLVALYGFNQFNDWFFVKGIQRLARFLFITGDSRCLDQSLVDGSGRLIAALSQGLRRFQSGYLYHYALVMVLALVLALIWSVWGNLQ